MLIQYHVWFSFKPETDVVTELKKVRDCLDDLVQRGMIARYRIFKKRAGLSNNLLPPFQATMDFVSDEQLALPFADVQSTGIHQGLHGIMIENVAEMIVETFEELESGERTET